jgi:hypothetical protein
MTLKHCCRGPTACTHHGQAITERERERERDGYREGEKDREINTQT